MRAMNSPMVRGLAMRLAGIACVVVISLVAYRRAGGITLTVVLLGLAVSTCNPEAELNCRAVDY
jgi:hypothetical protein